MNQYYRLDQNGDTIQEILNKMQNFDPDSVAFITKNNTFNGNQTFNGNVIYNGTAIWYNFNNEAFKIDGSGAYEKIGNDWQKIATQLYVNNKIGSYKITDFRQTDTEIHITIEGIQ